MKHIPTTATAVEKLKKQAKAVAKDQGIPLVEAQESVAKEAGYQHWHHVVLCAEETKCAVTKMVAKVASLTRSEQGPPVVALVPASLTPPLGLLSKQQMEILKLLQRGWNYHEIAAAMNLTLATTTMRVDQIRGVLGARSVAEAVEQGLLLKLLKLRSDVPASMVDAEAMPTPKPKTNLQEAPSGFIRYKCRAECQPDIEQFLLALKSRGVPVMDLVLRQLSLDDERVAGGRMPLPDMELELSAQATAQELIAVAFFATDDCHIIGETLQPIDQYTGERDDRAIYNVGRKFLPKARGWYVTASGKRRRQSTTVNRRPVPKQSQ